MEKRNDGVILMEYKENFYNYFANLTDQEIYEFISFLDEKSQLIVKLYYGIDSEKYSIKEIASKYAIDDTYVFKCIDNSIKRIAKKFKRNDMLYKLYLEFDGYTKSQIDESYYNLPDNSKRILNLYYGIDCTRLDCDRIAFIEGITKPAVYKRIEKALDDMRKYLSPNYKAKIMQEKFYNFFEEYSREQVDEVVSKLEEIPKKIISYYYGLDGECFSQNVVANICGVKHSTMSIRIQNIIEQISEILENPMKKQRRFYDQFIGYSTHQVNEALSLMDKRSIEIISLYYGLNGEFMTQKQLSEKYGLTVSSISDIIVNRIPYRIWGLLQNKNNINGVKSKNLYLNLIFQYGEENVNEAILELNPKRQRFIKLYFVGENPLSIEEIANKYKTPASFVSKEIKGGLVQVKLVLERQQIATFYSLFKGYTKVQVDEVLQQFIGSDDYKYISLRYGLDNHKCSVKELSEMFKMNEKEISEKIKKFVLQIKKSLIDNEFSSRRDKFQQIVNKYGNNIVLECLEKMTVRKKEFMKIYFLLDDSVQISLSDFAAKTKTNEAKLNLMAYNFLSELGNKILLQMKKH
jgi:DNA-directed RNA polymerase specialized sigma subunit